MIDRLRGSTSDMEKYHAVKKFHVYEERNERDFLKKNGKFNFHYKIIVKFWSLKLVET